MLKLSVSNLKALANVAKVTIVKHGPEILMAVGAVSFVGTVVTASKATINSQEILEEHRDNLRDIEIFDNDNPGEINPKKERLIVYKDTSLALAKEYAPATALGAVSLTCFFSAFGIMRARYTTLAVAYTALEKSFREYRQRVIADKGEEADLYYLTGTKPKEITTKDEDGKKVKKKQLVLPDGTIASPYAFKFGKYREDGTLNVQWINDPVLLRGYALGQAGYLNCQLSERCVLTDDMKVKIRGAVLLNEIRDLFGEGPTETGAVAGNRYSNGEPGCNGYIDLHIIEAIEEDPETGDMIPCLFINPNCDGLIFDLLGKKEKVPFPWHDDNVWGEDDII